MKKTFTLLLACIFAAGSYLNAQTRTLTVGDYKISLLNETAGKGYANILINDTPEILEECLFDDGYANATNSFLIQTPGNKNILIDAGLGINTLDNLEKLGLEPQNINVILLTHMHNDHIGGLMTEGKATFGEATLLIPKVEYDYWKGIDIRNDKSQEKRAGAYEAFQIFKAYKDRIQTFKPSEIGDSATFLLDSIKAIAAYGHTPGHTMFMIESKGQKLLIWADLTHALAVQMPYPQVAVTYDNDSVKAVESRKKVLEYVAGKDIPVTGMHVPDPFFGTVSSNNKGGYIFSKLDPNKYKIEYDLFIPKMKKIDPESLEENKD